MVWGEVVPQWEATLAVWRGVDPEPQSIRFLHLQEKDKQKIMFCCDERKINRMQSTLRHINISIFQETTSYYVQILLLHEKGIF